MEVGAAKRRNSRWGDAPILDRDGRPRIAVVTERDINGILKPLARHRYLPVDYLHAFAGGSLDYLTDRLALLSRRPNSYLARPTRQRDNAAANHRRLIYELADRGVWLLRERGILVERGGPPANFRHELMASLIMASFEFGCRQTNSRLIGWDDILDSRSLPESTRLSSKPWAIPVSATIDGSRLETHVVADGHPFGIERHIDGRRSYIFCPGIEADCGTEPIRASDFARSSILKKFALYRAIEDQGVYRAHFGFPNLYVPIVTANAARLASMMRLLDRMTGGAGSKIFLFKACPGFSSNGKPEPPSGDMLSGDWQRVRFPPFNFVSS